MRYRILSAAVLMQICIGGLYAWSTFVPPLRETYALQTWQTQFLFGTLIFVFTTFMIPAGMVLYRVGPKPVALTGALLFSVGYAVAARSEGRFLPLLVGIGVLAGIGTGFCYVVPLSLCAVWFPDRKGLATGIVVGGFGGGAIILSFMAQQLLEKGWTVLNIFHAIALVYGLVLVGVSLGLRFPPTFSKPPPVRIDEWRVAIRDRRFLVYFVAIFSGTFAGLLVIGNLSPLLRSWGYAPQMAVIAIATFSAGNVSGRIVWGWLTDRLHDHAVVLSLLGMAFVLVFLILQPPFVALLAVCFLVGASFGSCFVIYATRVAAVYGTHHFPSLYPLIFLGYGVAGMLGPWAGGWLYDRAQDYRMAIGLALLVVMTSVAMTRLGLDLRREIQSGL